MRQVVAFLLVCACGGPSANTVIESSAAKAPAKHEEAPAASTSDKEREQLVQQFDDMQTTQEAYRESGEHRTTPLHAQPIPKPGAPPPPKKTGPAVQGKLPPSSK
jgi:hypothetical protein